MELHLDAYAHLDSPLHRWEPRCRLVGLLVLMFAFAFVRDVHLLLPMLTVTLGLLLLSRLPVAYILSRLRYPGGFFLLMAIVVPFVVGHSVLVHLGPLTLYREGVLFLLVLMTRFVSILTLGIILFGVTPFLISASAMRALGVPPLLVDMLLLTYRYLHDLGHDLQTMQIAMRLRGFRGQWLNRRNLGVLAALVGSLLVRSYAQSERVYHAMILRGYGASSAAHDQWPIRTRDGLLLALTVGMAILFGVFEVWLR